MSANTVGSVVSTPSPPLIPDWFTPIQAAAWINVHVDFIYNACASGGLKHSALGGRRNIRIKREWLDEWMVQHQRENR